MPSPPGVDLKQFRIPSVMVPPVFLEIMPKYRHEFSPLVRLIEYD